MPSLMRCYLINPVKRFRTISLVAALLLLPLFIFIRLEYVEWYWRDANADVRVNGVPAGYAHVGPHSTLVTRTDLPQPHSYRLWETDKTILIFDCHVWVAPNYRAFLQGRISRPCIFPMTAVSPDTPASPASEGKMRNGIVTFTTRDGKVITIRSKSYTAR
jgi:hypothetical protein